MTAWLKCLGSWCGSSGKSNLPAETPGDETGRTELPLKGLTPLTPRSWVKDVPAGLRRSCPPGFPGMTWI